MFCVSPISGFQTCQFMSSINVLNLLLHGFKSQTCPLSFTTNTETLSQNSSIAVAEIVSFNADYLFWLSVIRTDLF